jgi:hypothetical protein
MSELPEISPLETIYVEAGQWVRMCNAIIWSMGTILVPISTGCIGLALKNPEYKGFLAGASIFLFAVWVYISMLYRKTSTDARNVLMSIEESWSVPEQICLYKLHGQVGMRWYSLFNVQIVALMILVAVWAFLCFVQPSKAA